jgi:GNAT superfamily N-acetyltransferase
MLSIKLAEPQDASALADVQKRTFDEDARRYQNKDEDGPPGYDSVAWQAEHMTKSHYYKLLTGSVIIGGMIVFPVTEEEYHLGRIFIDPPYQNQGFGHNAFQFLYAAYPAARKWTLDTPAWAVRNHHFYAKQGFIQTGEIEDSKTRESIWEYERITPEANL